MGNCLNLWAVDEPYSSASAIARDCLGFDAILPFSTAADLAQLYELGCELGSGQSGVVCKCTDRASGIQFACKSISKLHLRTIANVRDVIREVNIMRRLSSRSSLHGPGKSREFNVVRLHDVVEDHSFVHLIVDLCNGGELFDRITRIKCYSEKKAAVIMKSLLESLQFCHSMGIMHRDVKPENLLLVDDSEEPNVKLADFGLALEFSPGQKFSNMAGSAYYMAPEVLRGEYSEEVDIWSAGVIMYVLLSGMPPFYGRTEQDIFKAIRRGQFDLSSDPWQWISHSAKDLIAKMLCVDVLSRCTIAQALQHPWIMSHNTIIPSISPFMVRIQHPDDAIRSGASPMTKDAAAAGIIPVLEEPDGAAQNLGSLQEEILFRSISVGLIKNNSTTLELSLVMKSLVDALEKKRASVVESLMKVRLQFGWTCTLLTTSSKGEIFMIDVGPEKYLIAHDRLRKRLGWKLIESLNIWTA